MDSSLILSKFLLIWLLVIWLKVTIADGSEINQTCVAEMEGMLVDNLNKFNEGDDVLISGHFHESGSIGTIWRRGEELIHKTLFLDDESMVAEVKESLFIPTEITRGGLSVKEEDGTLHIVISNTTASCSYQIKLPGHVAKTPMVTFTTDPHNERLLFIIETSDGRQIHILDFDSQHLRRVELDGMMNPCSAQWNPQETGLIIIASGKGSTCERYAEVDNYLVHYDLESDDKSLFSMPGHRVDAPTFSPDGETLAFFTHHTKDNKSMPASRNVLERVHLVNMTTHQPIQQIQMFEEKEILFSDKSSIFFLELEEGLMTFVNPGLLQRSERVLDVKDNRILTAKKDGFQTHIMLGHIVNNELTTTTIQQTTTTEEAIISTTEMETTTAEATTTTTTTEAKTSPKIPSVCQELFNSLMSEEEEKSETEAPTTEHQVEEMTTTVVDDTTTDYQPLITTTEIVGEIPKYTFHYHLLKSFDQNMAAHLDDGVHTHVKYKNMRHKNLLVLFPDIRNHDYYQERTLPLGRKIHHDILIIDYDLSEGLEGAVDRAENIINKHNSYESIVLYGDGLGATIVSLINIQFKNSKIIFSDPELNLLSLISDDHTILSWVLGDPFPFIPTSEEIVYLWDMSPLSNVHNMTSEQLILISQHHHKEAQVYYEHLREHEHEHEHEEKHEHKHEEKHEHNHAEKHEHNNEEKHEHNHEERHEHKHEEKHEQDHTHEHDEKHEHEHEEKHEHKHEENHEHKNEENHEHKHEENHEQKHEHKHEDQHEHKHEEKQEHNHGEKHEHEHEDKNEHNHKEKHEHNHEEKHEHEHEEKHEHKHEEKHEHEHKTKHAEIHYSNTDKYLATGKWLIHKMDFSHSCRVEMTTSATSVPPTRPTTKPVISSAAKDKTSFVQIMLLLSACLIVMK